MSFDRNRYSAPCELVGQIVSVRIYPERIDLAYRSWLAWEQRLDDAVDKCYLADRIAKLTQR